MRRNVFDGVTFFFCFVCISPYNAWEIKPLTTTTTPVPNLSRRNFIPIIFLAPLLPSAPAQALDSNRSEDQERISTQPKEDTNRPFVSAAFNRKELTNSIIASQDTNISPAEVYQTILRLKKEGFDGEQKRPSGEIDTTRALDVGAGAGVSTQVIFQELGFVNIDAVDWSGDAWRNNVIDGGYCPPTVRFFELDDERFVEKWKREKFEKYDIIAFNFAVNKEKALFFCKNLLNDGGLLLAPVNTQQDYWLKQTYQLLDKDGKIVWSAADVGAWNVQFQPDVTQDTCQGVWCSPYNGFQKLRR